MEYRETYEKWCNSATDLQVKKALEEMSQDDERMKFAFSSNLSFGTAGLRAVMDAGTNCLNVYTVARATQGVCDYFVAHGGKTAVICYDSRYNSKRFAEITATVCAHAGLKVMLMHELQPTPVLSFCVRHYRADIGVMITASHNSKEYNGYKVYGSNGVQIDVDTAEKITEHINKTDAFKVSLNGFERFLDTGVITYVPASVIEEDYLNEVYKCATGKVDKLQVVYTPLNGAGHALVPQILKKVGLDAVIPVSVQSYPNGDFTTCAYPNPEKAQTLKMGMNKLTKEKADILLATDPDCDRVGVAVLHNGKAVQLSGNEVGILLTEYLLSVRKAKKTLPKNPIVIKTIVSSRLIDNIVAAYKGTAVSLLTGFKYIGEYVCELETKHEEDRFILGFEESCGYLVGSYAHDKDAVVASMLICCMASYYKKRGKTLIDQLDTIYDKYGQCKSKQVVYRFEGLDGDAKRKDCMDKLRNTAISKIAGLKVESYIDLAAKNSMNLPYADVLIYNLSSDSQVIVRPSGTEPLIKLYLSTSLDDKNAIVLFNAISQCFESLFDL